MVPGLGFEGLGFCRVGLKGQGVVASRVESGTATPNLTRNS